MSDCRTTGHDWPDRPGVMSPDYQPPAEPVTDTCSRCGAERTDYPNGTRHYGNPPAEWRTDPRRARIVAFGAVAAVILALLVFGLAMGW